MSKTTSFPISISLHDFPGGILDIYAPNKPINSPVVLYIPGGGFTRVNIKAAIVGLVANQLAKIR